MKATFIFAVVAVASTVSAYQCPNTTSVNQSCRSISVYPLVCNNPKVNVQQCNAKQCTQTYVDNYAACQCRRSSTQFYENSVNVEGLLHRCGVANLTNPFGNPNQYRPGQGTQTFTPSSSGTSGAVATRIYNGTTYYGGQTSVISGTTRIVNATAIVHGTTIWPGTTTWVSGTPGIIRGTSTVISGTLTAAPITSPTATPFVTTQGRHISGGAIAGIVLGCLAAAALAGLLGWCWRKKRAEHTTVYNTSAATYDNRGPTRTVVTEKIEPVVVKSVPTGATTTTYNTTAAPVVASSSVPVANAYHTTTGPAVGMNTAGVHNPATTTTYNTTTTTGYNTQPRVPGAVDSAATGMYNTTTTAGHGVNTGVNTVGRDLSNAANAVNNSVHNAASAVNTGAHNAANTANNAIH